MEAPAEGGAGSRVLAEERLIHVLSCGEVSVYFLGWMETSRYDYLPRKRQSLAFCLDSLLQIPLESFIHLTGVNLAPTMGQALSQARWV